VGTEETIIYHITAKQEWETALQQGFYEAASLAVEGFIHCSKAEQVAGVLERYFKGRHHLVKLVIDTNKLTSKLQYDFSPSVNEKFPHIYGPVNINAVLSVIDVC
jgi:Uncharacterized protein conserved in bacteria